MTGQVHCFNHTPTAKACRAEYH